MIVTDEVINTWVRNIISQNKRAKSVFVKIFNIINNNTAKTSLMGYTIISQKELQSLKSAQKKLFDIQNLTVEMLKMFKNKEK